MYNLININIILFILFLIFILIICTQNNNIIEGLTNDELKSREMDDCTETNIKNIMIN